MGKARRPTDAEELRRMTGLPNTPAPPQLVPDQDLWLIVAALMEALAELRPDFDKFDATGKLRRSYERFACDLRASGFRLDETQEARGRGAEQRRLSELAERCGNVAAAITYTSRITAGNSTTRLTYASPRGWRS